MLKTVFYCLVIPLIISIPFVWEQTATTHTIYETAKLDEYCMNRTCTNITILSEASLFPVMRPVVPRQDFGLTKEFEYSDVLHRWMKLFKNTNVLNEIVNMTQFEFPHFEGMQKIESMVFPLTVMGQSVVFSLETIKKYMDGYPINGTTGTFYDMRRFTELKYFKVWSPYAYLSKTARIEAINEELILISVNMNKGPKPAMFRPAPYDKPTMNFVFWFNHDVNVTYS